MNSTRNQRKKYYSANSDCGDDNEISHQVNQEGLEALQSTFQPAKDAGPSLMVTMPKRKDLSHIGTIEAAFENGYDSDENKGIYLGATHLEGEQIFEEETIPPWVAAAAAAGIANAIDKDSGNNEDSVNVDSSKEDSGKAARRTAARRATGSSQL